MENRTLADVAEHICTRSSNPERDIIRKLKYSASKSEAKMSAWRKLGYAPEELSFDLEDLFTKDMASVLGVDHLIGADEAKPKQTKQDEAEPKQPEPNRQTKPKPKRINGTNYKFQEQKLEPKIEDPLGEMATKGVYKTSVTTLILSNAIAYAWITYNAFAPKSEAFATVAAVGFLFIGFIGVGGATIFALRNTAGTTREGSAIGYVLLMILADGTALFGIDYAPLFLVGKMVIAVQIAISVKVMLEIKAEERV